MRMYYSLSHKAIQVYSAAYIDTQSGYKFKILSAINNFH